MRRNKLVRFGGIVLAAAVLVTGSWYTSQETGTTVPQLAEYVDTEDGSIVIPEEEVPLATKPTVKVTKTTKRTTKKSKMKTKAKKTATTTSRSKKTSNKKQESSTKKVATETTVLTTVVSATKKQSNIKTVTTTVETTVKTTTTNKPKTTTTTAKTTTTATAAKPAASTASSSNLQTVSTVNVQTIAPKAHANVLKAFESMEFKIEVNPTVSYSGYFNAKNRKITLKKNSSDTIYHELGHFVGWLAGNVDTSSAFTKIYNAEKGAVKSANYQYVTQNSSEYFAESYKDFVLSPQSLKASRPQTYEYVASAVEKITEARTATIKAAYMKAYWS